MGRGSNATPIVGVDGVVELTPEAGGPTVTIKNNKYKIQPSNGVQRSTNTTDGVLRAPGLNDYTGSFEGDTDATSTTTSIEAQALPGQIWNFKLYRSKKANTFYAGTIILGENLSIETGTDMIEHWSFDFAKAYGPLVLPNGSEF